MEPLLSSVALRLLVSILERINSYTPVDAKISQKDRDMILKSQDYLLSRLFSSFPGMDQLAEIANMSVSKYKMLYKGIFGVNPGVFFKEEKLLLAKELLSSGRFESVAKVAVQLEYNKLDYFTIIYKKYFGNLPSDDFVKA